MAGALGVDYPFLDAAYRQRPQYDDTQGKSFIQAYQFAQQQKLEERKLSLEEAMQPLKIKMAQQHIAASQLQIADAIKKRDDSLEAEIALSTFGERIRRAKILGPNEPSAQQGVLDWAQRYRGLLTTPEGKSMWEDYMQSVDEDRKHAAQLETLKLGIDERAGIAAATIQSRQTQAFDIEQFRQENRTKLETQREQFRRELATDPAASRVSEDQYVNRHLNSYVGPPPYMKEETIEQRGAKFAIAEKALRDMYREAHSTNAAPRAVTAPAPTPAVSTAPVKVSTKAERDALPKGASYIGPDGMTYIKQ